MVVALAEFGFRPRFGYAWSQLRRLTVLQALNVVSIDPTVGQAVCQCDRQRDAGQELTVVGDVELGDIVGGGDAEQLAAYHPGRAHQPLHPARPSAYRTHIDDRD